VFVMYFPGILLPSSSMCGLIGFIQYLMLIRSSHHGFPCCGVWIALETRASGMLHGRTSFRLRGSWLGRSIAAHINGPVGASQQLFIQEWKCRDEGGKVRSMYRSQSPWAPVGFYQQARTPSNGSL